MEKYKYIIIDDEYPLHLTINHHFKNHPKYTCTKTFYNPEKALKFLKKNDVDLIFLDIEMPEMNGFQFLDALDKNIFVVILTAYPEKYSLNAHHFIDKDLVFFSNKAQFLYYFPKIIARFEKLYAEKEIINRMNQLSKNEIYTFPKKINNKSILLTEIVFILVIRHNIVLTMKNGSEFVFRMSFLELKDFLPANVFLQIRRNIIINIMYVTAFSGTTVCLKDHHFVISERKQKEVISILKAEKREFDQ